MSVILITTAEHSDVQDIFKEWNEVHLENEAYTKRNQMGKIWNRLIYQRKQVCWKERRSKNLAGRHLEAKIWQTYRKDGNAKKQKKNKKK